MRGEIEELKKGGGRSQSEAVGRIGGREYGDEYFVKERQETSDGQIRSREKGV